MFLYKMPYRRTCMQDTFARATIGYLSSIYMTALYEELRKSDKK